MEQVVEKLDAIYDVLSKIFAIAQDFSDVYLEDCDEEDESDEEE